MISVIFYNFQVLHPLLLAFPREVFGKKKQNQRIVFIKTYKKKHCSLILLVTQFNIFFCCIRICLTCHKYMHRKYCIIQVIFSGLYIVNVVQCKCSTIELLQSVNAVQCQCFTVSVLHNVSLVQCQCCRV